MQKKIKTLLKLLIITLTISLSGCDGLGEFLAKKSIKKMKDEHKAKIEEYKTKIENLNNQIEKKGIIQPEISSDNNVDISSMFRRVKN